MISKRYIKGNLKILLMGKKDSSIDFLMYNPFKLINVENTYDVRMIFF